MLGSFHAFGGFSVDDLDAAREFYGTVLGVELAESEMGTIDLKFTGGGHTIVYEKSNHLPATFTVLNFEVDDIDAAVDQLAAAGVTFERYDGMDQDAKGIARGKAANMGPDIAWFTDPAGNILSVLAT